MKSATSNTLSGSDCVKRYFLATTVTKKLDHNNFYSSNFTNSYCGSFYIITGRHTYPLLLLLLNLSRFLISAKDIPCVYFVLYIVQTTIIAVCDNSLALFLKFLQIVHNFASEEGTSIF